MITDTGCLGISTLHYYCSSSKNLAKTWRDEMIHIHIHIGSIVHIVFAIRTAGIRCWWLHLVKVGVSLIVDLVI